MPIRSPNSKVNRPVHWENLAVYLLMGKGANPCSTARQGRLVKPALQATDLVPPGKNQMNIEEDTWSSYQILS